MKHITTILTTTLLNVLIASMAFGSNLELKILGAQNVTVNLAGQTYHNVNGVLRSKWCCNWQPMAIRY